MKRIHTESKKGRRGHKCFPADGGGFKFHSYTGNAFGAIAAIIASAMAGKRR